MKKLLISLFIFNLCLYADGAEVIGHFVVAPISAEKCEAVAVTEPTYGLSSESKLHEMVTPFFINIDYVSGIDYVTLSPLGYATFYSSESDFTLPEGLSAQVVTGFSNNTLTYKTIADGSVGGVIPKGTAVVLVNDNKTAGTFTLTSTASSAKYTGINYLHGSNESTTTSASGDNHFYKLSYGEGVNSDVFGWYWGTINGSAFHIDGHKAWLALPKSSATRSSFAMNETIEIENAITDESTNIYYDLQGRRVGTPSTSGIYIVNGKKVVYNK